ncbi:MAG: sigma factor-like helix-turn-helix DNA-binding protein [Patescibacteria group bacterium]|nr:hypothetical protein [Patescibacteria group bacterium]
MTTQDDLQKTLVNVSDLVKNLLVLLSDKEKVVIQKRFNLDHKRRHTLEEIGRHFSVTRERIRQIEKSALTKLRRNVFNTGLTGVLEYAENILKDNGNLISERKMLAELINLVSKTKDVDVDAIRLSLSLHSEFVHVGNTIYFTPYFKAKTVDDGFVKDVSDKAIKLLQKKGDVAKSDKFAAEISKLFKSRSIPSELIMSIMEIDKRIKVLDSAVGLMDWRHINPRTLRDKIFFILRESKKPMHFVDISNKITELHFDSKIVNTQAVHNELIRHPEFVLIGRGIYALKEWGYERGTVADVIVKLLKAKKTMSQDEIVEEVLRCRQVKKITIVLALKNGKKFERVGRRQYKLA